MNTGIRHRPSFLASALAVVTAGIGSAAHGAPQSAMGFKINPDHWRDQDVIYSLPPRTSGITKGRIHGNQRQIRKDRRRAHAAGKKNAFK